MGRKKLITKYRVIGLDTETYLDSNVMKPFLVQLYSADYVPEIEEIFEVFREEEIERLSKFLFNSKVRGSILVTFNMGFDLSVLARLGIKVKMVECGGRFITAKLEKSKHVVRVIDLRNILQVRSLWEVGRALGIPKMERPLWLGYKESLKYYLENETYRNYFREYALNDAKICYWAFKELLKSGGIERLKSTSGALSMYLFSNHYQYLDFPNYPNEVEVKLKNAYRGGRVEVFKRGVNDKKVYYYDINSLYPYVMLNGRFPYNYNNGVGRFKKKSDVDLDFEGVAKVKVLVDSDVPPLGVKRLTEDGYSRLIFPEGVIVDWFTYPELRYLENGGYGKILKVYESFEFKVWCYPFTEYIKDMYGKRLLYKDFKILNKFYKIMMNSLYGKFGEYKTGKIMELEGNAVRVLEEDVSNKMRYYHNIVWASYVTAYGRLELHRRLRNAGFKNIYYCDTDSLITSTEMDTGDEIGQLKFEGEGREGEVVLIRSKFYIFGNTIRFRGFTLDCNVDTLKSLIKKGINYVKQERILKPLEAYRRGLTPLVYEVYRKFFNTETDYKRVYHRLLNGAELLEGISDSNPRKLVEGGLDGIN